MTETPRSAVRTSRGWVVPAIIIAVFIAGGLGWASAVVFAPPPDPLNSPSFTTVEVTGGTVGSTLALNAVATWSPEPAGTNGAVGVVTSVTAQSGQETSAGSVLYAVDLRPVIVAQGATPSFRSLSRGSEGADVAQLQQLLAEQGFYASQADGTFGTATERAVKSWQRALQVEPSGVVTGGDIIFVPGLPARIWLDDDIITRGARLGGGEAVLSILPTSPDFRIPVTDAQSALIPDGATVALTSSDGTTWTAIVGRREVDDDAQLQLLLQPNGDQSICGAECATITVSDQSTYPVTIELVPSIAGLVVPSAALYTKADGTVTVIDASGKQHTVTVLASAQGMSAIDGVEKGVSVRVPAKG